MRGRRADSLIHAGFGIGLLSRLELISFKVQALVVRPSREPADQVCKEIRRLARFTQNIEGLALCGDASFGQQADSLEVGGQTRQCQYGARQFTKWQN